MELDLNQKEEYKETELGLLPNDWEVVRLGDVVNFETGKRMKGGALKSGHVLSLGGEHIGDFGLINLSEQKFISKQFYDELKKGKLNTGDVIICKDGAKTGKAAYISQMPAQYAAVNEHIFIIRSRNSSQLINQFIFFFIFSSIGQKQVRKAYHGLIGGITNTDISNFKIPLPPLSEQKKIAYVLSTVQEAKEKTENVIKAMKELKKSIMKHLFTYGPVSLEEAEKITLKETEIGLIPEEWEVVKLGNVGNIITGNTPSKKIKEYWDNGKLDFIKPPDLQNRVISTFSEKISNKAIEKARIVKEGSILVSCIGAIGRVGFASHRVAFNQQINAIEPNNNINKWFLFYVLQTQQKQIENLASFTTVPIVSKGKFVDVKIPLPPLSEQKKIASILSAIDRKIEAEENKKKALEDLFKSLLHNLMTAKIRVNHLEKILD
ncbi:restriction endonuclease subunit S [Petrotoga sp. DB-2]